MAGRGVGRSSSFYAGDGSQIEVGRELGRGGEGAVYDIANRPNRVAKIYLSPIDSQKAEKLHVMVSQCTSALTKLAAWPLDVVLDHRRQVAGLVMNKINGFRPVHELYTPKSRLQEFPGATWAFLVHAATNVARAFAVMHSHKVVIGDVNHGNVLVNDAAVCTLIDCDSFQVTNNGHRFLCEVGVSTYTPPELQGKDFATFVRTENHDNFGLALLIFHLLLMGRHPFAGRFLGTGEMPVERAIREYRFAFAPNSRELQMAPPPNSLGLYDLPPKAAALFEQAFSLAAAQDSGRPKAAAWIESLESLSRELIICPRNSSHCYYKRLIKCPWCRLEERSAIAFFLQFDLPAVRSDFKIDAVWTRIMAVSGPGPAPELDVQQQVTTVFVATADAQKMGRQRRTKISIALGILIAGAVIALFAGMTAEAVIWIVGLAIGIANTVWGAEKALEFRVAHDRAAARYESLEDRWQKEASDAQFFAKRRELEAVRKELESLPRLRHERMRALETNRKEIQLQKWLDSHYIRAASIPGIGPGRKAVLASYGIDTAADLSWQALEAVQGIGPRYATALMLWRDSVAAKFVFNPRLRIDAQEVAKLDREIANRGHYLQQRFLAGIPELQIIRDRTIATRKALQKETLAAYQEFMQAEANLKAC